MYPQVIAEPGRRSAAKQAASCGGIWISGFSDEGSDTRDGLYTRDAKDGNGAPHYSNSASFHLYVNAAGEWCVNSQFHPETKTCAAFWKGGVAKLVDASWTDGGKPRRLAIAEVSVAGAAAARAATAVDAEEFQRLAKADDHAESAVLKAAVDEVVVSFCFVIFFVIFFILGSLYIHGNGVRLKEFTAFV